MSADLTQVEAIVMEAQVEAAKACRAWLAQHGDRDACGFAWCNVWGVRSNSKLGNALKAAGFRKDYTGSLQFWNPAKSGTQSISALEAGAEAFAKVLKEKLGLEKCYAGSRLD
jgi:hypothetical protein